MGVPPHQLVAYSPGDIIEIAASLLLRQLAVENDLQEQVPQFLLQVHPVLTPDGIDRLIGLLNQIGHQAGVSLLRIPGTAPRRPQPVHDGPQPFHLTPRLGTVDHLLVGHGKSESQSEGEGES